MTSKDDILRQRCRLRKVDFNHECEEDLTIGIGFRCSDGIVLAGDRLRTKKNDIGRFVTKVRDFKFRKNLLGAMVGAGTSRYLDPAHDWFDRALKNGMSLNAAQEAIDKACKKMRNDYMRRSGDEEEPHFSFLLALWNRKEGFRLLLGASDAPLSVVEDHYATIGKGASLANCLVGTFCPPNGTCQDGALISAMVVRLVKRFVTGCGGGTNIIAVMEGGLAKPINKAARKRSEEHFLKFFEPVRVDLRKFIRRECQSPLLVRRFPREEKTRRSLQR